MGLGSGAALAQPCRGRVQRPTLSVRPAELTTGALCPASSGVIACCTRPMTVSCGCSGCHVNEV